MSDVTSFLHFDGGIVADLSLSSSIDWADYDDGSLRDAGEFRYRVTRFYRRRGRLVYTYQFIFYDADCNKLATLWTDSSFTVGRVTFHWSTVRDSWELLLSWFNPLSEIGFTVISHALKRVDISLDTSLSYSYFRGLISKGYFRTKLSRQSIKVYNSSFMIGDISNIQVCMYDKVQELRIEKDIDLRAKKVRSIASHLNNPAVCTRIEYRLGRRWFSRFNISTFQDFNKRKDSIFSSLSRYTFCFQNTKYKETCAVFALWKKLTNGACSDAVRFEDVKIEKQVVAWRLVEKLRHVRRVLKNVINEVSSCSDVLKKLAANLSFLTLQNFIKENKEFYKLVDAECRDGYNRDVTDSRSRVNQLFFDLFCDAGGDRVGVA